jgi:hypothetical protein
MHTDITEAYRPVDQVVSHRPSAVGAQIRYQASLCEICDGRSGTGTGVSPSTSVPLVIIIPPLLHPHVSFHHLRLAIKSTVKEDTQIITNATSVKQLCAIEFCFCFYRIIFRSLTVVRTHICNSLSS